MPVVTSAQSPRDRSRAILCSGTPYRIRTDGLRLERAVSWATRRTGPEGPGSYQRPDVPPGSDLVGGGHAEGVQRIGKRDPRGRDQPAPEASHLGVLLADDRRHVLVEITEGRRQIERVRGEQRR